MNYHRERFRKLTFRALALRQSIRSDELNCYTEQFSANLTAFHDTKATISLTDDKNSGAGSCRQMFQLAIFEKLVYETLQPVLWKNELDSTFACIADNLINRK